MKVRKAKKAKKMEPVNVFEALFTERYGRKEAKRMLERCQKAQEAGYARINMEIAKRRGKDHI